MPDSDSGDDAAGEEAARTKSQRYPGEQIAGSDQSDEDDEARKKKRKGLFEQIDGKPKDESISERERVLGVRVVSKEPGQKPKAKKIIGSSDEEEGPGTVPDNAAESERPARRRQE